jgi:outer membrane protein TolC
MHRRLIVFAATLCVEQEASADLLKHALTGPEVGGSATVDSSLMAWAGEASAVTLAELLQFAVQHAPSLQSATIDLAAAEARIEQTWARRDWTLRAQAAGMQSGATLFSGIQVSGQSTATVGADLFRVLPTGGTIGLRIGTQYSNVNSSFFSSKAWSDAVSGTFAQPLLRGFGSKVYNAAEQKLELSRDATTLAQRLTALQTVQTVVAAYWDLVLAERQVAITEASLALAEERLRVTQIAVKGGKTAAAEVPAVELAIATRQEDVLNGELAVLDRSIAVRRSVGMPIAERELALRVATDLEISDRNLELHSLLERAYAASPELASLAKQDKAATIDIEVTDNDLLPQLDLALSLGPTGFDPSFTGAAKKLIDLKTYQISGSLTFSRSLHAYDIHGRSNELRAGRQKLRVNALDVRAQIAQAMARAVAQVELAKRRIVLSQKAIELAAENVRIETDRFNLGRSTNFDVLNRLEEQRQAELRKAQAQVDWHKAEAVVLALTGDLLPAFGISLGSK